MLSSAGSVLIWIVAEAKRWRRNVERGSGGTCGSNGFSGQIGNPPVPDIALNPVLGLFPDRRRKVIFDGVKQFPCAVLIAAPV